ncbi:class I adenylate-forming enzyme family protein [Microbacterium luticocti]|uniref:class I adenylate-forming enzyme family protein n=1 Tax=Microbacterium luticocti TaxID=451764 RepID=UPI000A05D9B1|nr:class I adenylate-forming enzyme family protein [Microbacterium luticocti]
MDGTAANTATFLLENADLDAPAWIEHGRTWTYRDVHAAAADIAARLRGRRLRPGTPVGLYAGNGLFWIAAYLAVFAEGLVAVPLATTLGADEAVRRAVWAGCRVLACGRTQRSGLARLADAAGLSVLGEPDAFPARHEPDPIDTRGLPEPADVGGLPAAADAASARLHPVPVDQDADAAYLFTSGTTGTPRAVRITHANLRANTESILAYLPLTAADRTLVVLPFSYVFGASLLHTHLRAGAALAHQASAAYPETVVDSLADLQCTGFAGVPAVFHALVRNSTFTTRSLPALHIVQQAGGALAPAVADELVQAHPQAQLFVMYGQTEATARLSYLPPAERTARRGSIGRGIPGVQLRVVDAGGHDVRPGQIGEIIARGRNISPGYLRDPEASARKMGDGVLRTGDLATVDDDGYIYVVDRVEDFIKSWGHRVASTDVEAAAMELAEVVSAVAVGVPDELAGERIELVAVLRDGSQLDEQTVLAHCRRRLPRHMVPTRVRLVAELPLNANGKVLKRAVRELCLVPGPSGAAVTALDVSAVGGS